MIMRSKIRRVVTTGNYHEIKDKKGSDYCYSHLSRLEMTAGNEKGTEIAETFPDEQLFLLSVQTPWYDDIVN